MTDGAGLILANRAYCDHDLPPGDESQTPDGRGGLLAALRPAIVPWDGSSGTVWIGAGRGSCDRQYTDDRGYEVIATARGALRHRRLYFDDEKWIGHYVATANSFLWPLLHLVRDPLPDRTRYYPRPESPLPGDWAAYEAVNREFAEAAAEDPATCWIHDYQLALVPGLLRATGFTAPIGFFLHTPFPDLELAREFLDDDGLVRFAEFVLGILGADLAGFQSEADVNRFARAVAELGAGQAVEGGVSIGGRTVRIGVYPVGIEPEEVLREARKARTPPPVAEARAAGLPVVVGLERADFTKGIPERLSAVAALFRRGTAFLYAGVAAPTRGGIAAYADLGPAIAVEAARCEAAAASAGGRFLYSQQFISWSEVVAFQRDADVVFTSSLADGMNLVPLQAAVAQSLRAVSERAVIITGRDAGVAHAYAGFERDGLVPVDPLDVDQMTATLAAALGGQPGRVSDRLIAAVRANDARTWASTFLADLEAALC